MGQVLDHHRGFLVSGQSAEGTGGVILPTFNAANYGYLWYQASGESAIFNLEASHDSTGWLIVATYTATATLTGTAQIAGMFPYLRANVTELYTATGAGGTATGVLWAHFTPGAK
jgi:hypothetical protein